MHYRWIVIENSLKDNFQKAIDYGLKHGVSKEELDIHPRDITQEDW